LKINASVGAIAEQEFNGEVIGFRYYAVIHFGSELALAGRKPDYQSFPPADEVRLQSAFRNRRFAG
jgi:hypothetical protein